MTILAVGAPGEAAPRSLRLAPSIYAGTLFLSAFLLFAVQPMFTKMVLPRLGGAPTVWSVAMVFFQAALLGGYAYAHLVIRRLAPGVGALVHLGMLAAAAMALPIAIAQGFGAPPASAIALWLMGLMAVSLGLPFVALAASAPLLQGWFAASGHPRARNPYVLYAASNLGSFAALIAYPILIEPFLTLQQQAHLWSVGFAALALLVAGAALMVARQPNPATDEPGAAAVPLRDRIAWLALAAIPAGLVIAVTAYITTDLASAPFLWVPPLALYLLTFVAVFRERPSLRQEAVARVIPFAVAPLSIGLLGGQRPFWLALVVINLVAVVLLALLCHGELYRRRPAPARLTEFYLWVSFGGVVGGVFAALVAPNVFTLVYEYPILIAAALLALPGMFAGGIRRFALQAGPGSAARVARRGGAQPVGHPAVSGRRAAVPDRAGGAGRRDAHAAQAAGALSRARCTRFRLDRAVAAGLSPGGRGAQLLRRPSCRRDRRWSLSAALSRHDAAWRARIGDDAAAAAPEPLTYYYFGGPISEAIERVRAARGRLEQVAVVGLGSGSLACHKRAMSDGRSSRSIQPWCASRATRACSASSPPARPIFPWSSAMRGSRSPHRRSAMTSSSSMRSRPMQSRCIC